MFVTSDRKRLAEPDADLATPNSDARWRVIVGAVPLPLTITRRDDDTIVYVNQHWCALAGLSAEQASGRKIQEFYVDPAERVRLKAALGDRGSVSGFETQLKYGDRVVWAQLSCARFTYDGQPCVLAIVQDRTEVKKAERLLLEAKEAAESADRMKSEFLASMSHELRTPLNAILGFSDLISQEALGAVGNERYVEYARDIHESGAILLQLINDILDVARIGAGRMALSEDAFDLGDTIQRARHMVEHLAADRRLDLAVEAPPQPLRMLGDERRVMQILLNLLSNAIKFTSPGGRVAVGCRVEPGGEIAVSVADNGIGIKPEDVARALEPFVQLDASLSRQQGGSGLGLSIVHSLAEMHGGRVAIDSAPGRGTTVRVVFPAARLCRTEAGAEQSVVAIE